VSVISSGVAITDTGAATDFVWTVQDLAVGQGGTIILTGVLSDPLAAGSFTNTAEIAATTVDTDTTNNIASAGLTVVPRPEITFGNSSYTVSETGGQVDVNVLLSQPIPLTVTAGYYSSDGTASSTSDYQAVAGGLMFAPNETVLTITVPITDDLIDENMETAGLTLENPMSAQLGTPYTTTIQITDDDLPPTVTLTLTGSPMAEAGGTATVTATLSAVSSKPVTVSLTYVGTATNISDYNPSGSQIVIPAGSLSGKVTLTAVQDTLDEPDETIVVDISSVFNGTEAGGTQRVTAIIADDDFNLVINEMDYDQPSTDTAEFIELKNIGIQAINLDNYVVELFNGATGTVYNAIDLPNVNLAAGDYYVICTNNATVSNCDLDVTPNSDLIQNGAPDAVGLRLSGTLKDTVSYEGDSGAPYVEGSGAGLTDAATNPIADKDKGISRIPDGTDTNQNNVDFSLRCITPGAANTVDNSQCGAPVIEFTLAGYQVNEDGTAVGASVTLTRTGKITNTSEVQVNFTDDTALGSGVDYTSDPNAITFPAGDTNAQTVNLPIVQDFLDEDNEVLTMTLTAVTNAFISNQDTATLTIIDDDTAAIVVTPTSGLTTTEAGGTDTFQLVLESQPTNLVTVTVVSSDPDEGAVSPASVTFTALTWNKAQTITITGQDDTVDDGDQGYTIQATAQSSDDDYNGISVADVSVTNLDDDTRGVTVTPTSLSVTEGGITDTYTVVLDSEPTANVTVNVSSGTQLAVKSTSPTYDNFISLSFTTLNWDKAQTVTVQAVDDSIVEGDHSAVITHTVSGGDYGSESANDVTAAITDNDVAYTLTVDQATVTEGDVGSSPVVFTIARTGAVTTTGSSITFDLNGSATNGADYNNISPAIGSVAFAVGEVNQTISLDVLGDYIVEADETISMTLSSPAVSASSGTAIISGSNPVAVAILNDDVPGVNLDLTDGFTITEGGALDSYTIILNSVPTAAVTITITPGNQLDLGAGSGNAISLNFAADLTALDPQTVTVTAVDDAIAEGVHTGLINHTAASSDPNYNGGVITFTVDTTTTVGSANVMVNITDNDSSGVNYDPSNLTLIEPNGQGSITITLTSQPIAVVTINLSRDDASECDVAPSSVQLDSSNWQSGVPFVVTAQDDDEVDGSQSCIVTGVVNSTDPFYDGSVNSTLNFSVTVRVEDDNDSNPEATPIYLPIVVNNFVASPDLIITNLQVGDTEVTITIVNTGTAPVVDAFWIDVYFDLDAPPTVNQPWPMTDASHGVVWGLSGSNLPIMPGESRTLTLADAIQFFNSKQVTSDPPYPVEVNVYGYVDSVKVGSGFAAVKESNESNNVFGPVTSGVAGGSTHSVRAQISLIAEPMPAR
ncbi:MAG: lamin tail domain-containing protein, partial [Anaerolineae bacterium]|nr:lamin tail domain-containing protein [Anaerolineae bacterium]